MACLRSKMIVQTLHWPMIMGCIAYLDSDTIVRGSLKEFWDVKMDSIKVMDRPGQPNDARFQAGVFVIGDGCHIRAMMDDYDKVIQKENVFLREQEELYLSYQRHQDDVSLVPMDKKFNDWGFSDDSVIWHCKKKHFKNAKYQKEYRRWLNEANDKLEV